jgi:hypothetical protein
MAGMTNSRFEGFESNDLLKLAGAPYLHQGVKFQRGLLSFQYDHGCFQATTYRPFLPRGVIIWGAPPGATVEFFVGTDLNAVALGGAPARFFSMAENFAQLAKMLDEGKEPPAWVTWKAVDPGVMVRVYVRAASPRYEGGAALGPEDGIELAMWGTSLVG